MESLHRLFDWDCGIESMDLEKIYVVRLKPCEAGIHGIENSCPAQTALVDVVLQWVGQSCPLVLPCQRKQTISLPL